MLKQKVDVPCVAVDSLFDPQVSGARSLESLSYVPLLICQHQSRAAFVVALAQHYVRLQLPTVFWPLRKLKFLFELKNIVILIFMLTQPEI
jgi:hypothetical protein